MTPAARTLTILFADIGGSTALYERVGDVEAHRRVAESLAFMRGAIESNAGSLLRTVGDAALASFERSDDACRAAFEMQRLHASGPLSVARRAASASRARRSMAARSPPARRTRARAGAGR